MSAPEHDVKVYLIADNRLVREALTRILHKKANFWVVASTPYSPDSLKRVSLSGCHVLLLDSVAARLCGAEFIRDVVRAVPRLKVVLVGMEAVEENFLNVVRAGAVGYVLKDASAVDVATAVRAVASGEAVCPPQLSLFLFNCVAKQSFHARDFHVKLEFGLSRREQQLVPLISRGLTNKEIASKMNLSEQTVKNHIHNMLRKVGASNRLAIGELLRSQSPFLSSSASDHTSEFS